MQKPINSLQDAWLYLATRCPHSMFRNDRMLEAIIKAFDADTDQQRKIRKFKNHMKLDAQEAPRKDYEVIFNLIDIASDEEIMSLVRDSKTILAKADIEAEAFFAELKKGGR